MAHKTDKSVAIDDPNETLEKLPEGFNSAKLYPSGTLLVSLQDPRMRGDDGVK